MAAVEIAPRFPDAAIHMLVIRWGEGPLPFWLGVLFVMVYITLMVVGVRQTWPGGLMIFACVVVFGPWLTGALFWLVEHAAMAIDVQAAAFVAVLLPALGVPACLVICIGRDSHELGRLVGLAH